jgi:hypothetical protein
MQCADGAIVGPLRPLGQAARLRRLGPPPQLTDSLREPGETHVATVAMHAIDVPALPLCSEFSGQGPMLNRMTAPDTEVSPEIDADVVQ